MTIRKCRKPCASDFKLLDIANTGILVIQTRDDLYAFVDFLFPKDIWSHTWVLFLFDWYGAQIYQGCREGKWHFARLAIYFIDGFPPPFIMRFYFCLNSENNHWYRC